MLEQEGSFFDPLKPLSTQPDGFNSGIPDEKFFLTNPTIAHYGNLSKYKLNN
jgi:hypothetical protein